MNARRWFWAVGLFLVFLLWFMLEPGRFLRPSAVPSVESAAPGPISPSLPVREGLAKSAGSAKKPPTNSIEAEPDTGSGKEVPGERLIRFSSAEAYRKFLATVPPGMVLGQIDELNSVRVKTGSWLSGALAQSGGTASANFYVRVPEVPLDVREKGDTWYQTVGKKALDLIGADGVTEHWGRGVKVALMDTLVEGMDKLEGESAGHGTAMRSLIQGQTGAARGAAPGSDLLAFPVLDQNGQGNSFGLAEAILKATNQGVKVINMSLGSEGDSPLVRDAVAYALARNVVLVAAAGNEAVNRVSFPAAYDGVMAVAAVDASGNHLYFSNRGKSVDVAAPGFAVSASGPGGKSVEVTGTSASTALVTGAIAALLSREPGLSGRQAAELLVQYADASGLPGSAEEIGGGVVNLQRVLNRNQRGLVDMAVGGVTLKDEGQQGRILVGVQNRGTETANSPSLEITVGEERRKFYFGSLPPGGTATENMMFDLTRARQKGGTGAGAAVRVRGDQQSGNDLWAGYFRLSTP